MEFLLPSFLAGVLTVIAPCTVALLPVILGGTLGSKNNLRPLVIALSLGVSIVIFTLLLKATTALIGVPDTFWKTVSGGLVLLFGIAMVFPNLWNRIAFKLKLYKSENLLEKSSHKEGLLGAALLGASLGPVFSTCSPTYALIIAIVLPQSFLIGLTNIIAYALGLVIPFFIIGYGGQKITKKIRFAVNPNGWFKRTLGLLLILVGLAIFTGYDKVIETKILDAGYLGPIGIENSLIEKIEK